MSNITMNITKSTVSATAFLPGQAYKSALALAAAYEGEIGKTADGFFKATFSAPKTAKQFKLDWETAYNANRRPAPAPASKPASAPAQKPTASKPTTGKGKNNLTGEAWVKANPSCTRAEAAAHGLKGITKQGLKALKVELGVR